MIAKNKENLIILNTENIKAKIYTLRDQQVMLDRDIASCYGVEIRALNQAVKRNIERFPEHFMFQLTKEELESSRSQFVIMNKGRGYNVKYLPYVFTEQGVAMLSGVLKSETAVKVSIQIMDAFVTMRRFINTNAQIFQRLDRVELKQLEYDKNFEKIFDAIQSKDYIPDKKIFFDDQIFDAHKFVSNLIKSAKHSIILIDNYIDNSVLTLFSRRNPKVQVTIYTKEITKGLQLDLGKYNLQYPKIEIKEFSKAHDRFLIIDNRETYTFGASLKDLGKKWFAFSNFKQESAEMLSKLGEK
jgi:hypothetical protein